MAGLQYYVIILIKPRSVPVEMSTPSQDTEEQIQIEDQSKPFYCQSALHCWRLVLVVVGVGVGLALALPSLGSSSSSVTLDSPARLLVSLLFFYRFESRFDRVGEVLPGGRGRPFLERRRKIETHVWEDTDAV